MRYLSLLFLALRFTDYLATMCEGGIAIEANPVAVRFGLFSTMLVTSLFGLALVRYAKSRWGMVALVGIACIPLALHMVIWGM